MKTLDAMLAKPVTDAGTGKVVGWVLGEDWTPPGPTSTPHDRIVYLRNVAQHLRESAALARQLSDDGKRRAYDKAKDIADRALTLAKRIETGGAIVLEHTDQEELETTKAALEHVKNAAEDWGIAAFGVATIWLVLAGVGAFLYFRRGR